MRRRHKVGSPLLIGAAVVILLCILSAVYSGISGNSSPITRAAGTVVRPFQRFGTGVGHFFSKGLDYFTEFDALKAENEQLKQQISDNAQLVRDAQIALEENNQLRSQLGQPENTRTTTTVSASMLNALNTTNRMMQKAKKIATGTSDINMPPLNSSLLFSSFNGLPSFPYI